MKSIQKRDVTVHSAGPECSNDNHRLGVYERLWLVNQHCAALTQIVSEFAGQDLMRKRESKYFRLMIEEVRASSCQTVMDSLDEREVRAAAVASKTRLMIERKLFVD